MGVGGGEGGGGLASALHRGRGVGWGRGGGSGGVDAEAVLRPEIKCCQYLSSRAKCAVVLSAPVLSTSVMMRRRL